MPNPDTVEQADIELGKSLASAKEHPWVRLLVKVGDLGDQEPLYTAAAGVIALGLLSWNSRRARTGVSMLLAVAAADQAKSVAKRLVHRTRPYVLLDHGHYASDTGGSPAKPEQSFPSGHVACTVAAARAISRQQPGAAPWTAAFTALIGFARLAKGAHWPLDVAAGLVIGLAAEKVSSRVLGRLGIPETPVA